ncbi:MAG TPA: bifunctional tetrahydrofolate synthase/dihydrofolate synthase [Accumulibacter sp.]|nr:bifunctional tetrahydrofolate synthase/dihydrofolate synthase [Accumulibacter sp.]HQC81321.1 bifunctional tetrahydrofolate synthase/dihydrofolate synthase [Accumulibacter sp.]
MSGNEGRLDPTPAPTLSDWLAHLENLHPKGQAGIELGLDRVLRVKAALAPHAAGTVITVGGTNGKGSTCAYLEAIYTFAGFRVGCYASPHLLAYNERVRIDRAPVGDTALCDAFATVEAARRAAGDVPLTYFEFGTLAALEVFRAERLDVLILEVGLGGRLDAVNAYDADCTVVTGVALDHMDWLGATREEIGYEKAGIFRSGKPAVCADPEPPQALLAHARAIGADLHLLGVDFGYFGDDRQWVFWSRGGLRRGGLAKPALRGAGQLRNAAAALAVVEILRQTLPVAMQAIRRGLIELELPGRFQVLPGRPTVILDVAHNPEAVGGLADSLAGMAFFPRTFAVVGMLADKDIAGSLAPLLDKIDVWLLADLAGPRGATADALAGILASAAAVSRMETFASPRQAFERSLKLAGENDRIVVFGSFHTVAAVLRKPNNSH